MNTKAYILCPHTAETKMQPIDKKDMQEFYPLTYQYLFKFRKELDERNGFAGWEKEIQKVNFYAILRVGTYTFSKYKVVWRYIATEFITSVIGNIHDKYLGEKMLVPNEKIMYVSTNDEYEAYYLCGILSSEPIAFTIKSYMNPTSISAHVLEKLNIASFNKNDDIHIKIASLCKKGHKIKDLKERSSILEEINLIVADIYGISKEQLQLIRKSLNK